MKLVQGFSLIELLVVIGIIGILAAIIFPVYGRVRDSAYRSGDMSNMNAIRTALSLYKTDYDAYPPAILGYATGYMNPPSDFDPTPQDILPAEQVAQAVPAYQNSAFLYPKRLDSIQTARPAYDRVSDTAFTSAVWPQGGSLQKFGPNDGPVQRCVDIGDGSGPQVRTNYYYNISGFDVGTVQYAGGGEATRAELRYTLFWSTYTVATDPCSPTSQEMGNSGDDPRQLGYADPPENTVVTWDSFFRDYDSTGAPMRSGKRDIVLFLGGGAKPMDSVNVSQQAWQVTP